MTLLRWMRMPGRLGNVFIRSHFQADVDPAFAGVTAGAHHVFIVGPTRLSDLTEAEVESVLDALMAGTRRIVDEDGYPT
jgi:hypothetical protein